MKTALSLASAYLIVILLSACAAQNSNQHNLTSSSSPTGVASAKPKLISTPTTEASSVVAPKPTNAVLPGQQPIPSICLEYSENLPGDLKAQIQALNQKTCQSDSQRLQVKFGQDTGLLLGSWIYALVAPFTTVTDSIMPETLRNFWTSGIQAEFSVLGMTPETEQIFGTIWGKPTGKVETITGETVSDWVWQTKSAWAIFPFEELSPRLKVINMDGISPIQKTVNPEVYALSIPISLELPDSLNENFLLSFFSEQPPLTNRDPQKLASVILTGVTALVRATSFGMEKEGLNKPAEIIGQTLRAADITHVSNEASFAADCPDPQDEHLSLLLCSKPAYLETLQAIGTDIVELTGDHLNDWGDQALLDSLTIYEKAGIKTFGGGSNSISASEPALFEVNGNKIAFIGCNSKHVGYPMATTTTPGALDCDMDTMVSQIDGLAQRGYMPIVGLQHTELSSWYPSERMQREFTQLARAGAVIVSGSEAHRPQTFTFGGADGNSFLHYGLGNLFFDQDTMGGDYDKAFIDRHVFYDGRYISTEILTIQFPNSLTPVWADAVTRSEMLNMFFWTSGLVPSPW